MRSYIVICAQAYVGLRKNRRGLFCIASASAEASTPALALCAAFARAMAEREKMKEAAE